MGQYTTSIKALIELEAYKNNTPITSIDDYVKIGRNLFFNFTYDGNNIFKEYFERKFILYYLEESINKDFPPLWVQYLASAVQTSAPFYFLKWQGVNALTLDKILSDGIRITDIDKAGNNSGDNRQTTNSGTTTSDRTVDTFTGSARTVGDEDTTRTGNNTSTTTIDDTTGVSGTSETTASATGSSANKNSAFPSNLDITTSLNSVNYAVDGGKVDSTNSSTTDTTNSSTTDTTGTHTTTDTISETNNTDIDTTVTTNNSDTRTSNGTTEYSQNTVGTQTGAFDETEHINEQMTGNLLDKVIKMYAFDFDIIDDYVKSFRNLFMYIW